MKEIPTFPGYYAYKDTRIWSNPKGTSNPKGKFLTHHIHHSGYEVVSIVQNRIKKTYPVHRLMALTFLLNPLNLPTINHINGNKLDNRVENLEWASMEDNIRHAERYGLRKHNDWGEKNTRSKLTNRQALEVKNLALDGVNQREIAKNYHISQALVSRIKLGQNYGKLQ